MKPFTTIAVAIFTIVAVVHLLRIFLGWEVVILARMIHERFCCNRGFAAATRLHAACAARRGRARRSVGQRTAESTLPSFAAPRTLLATRLRDFATNRHE